MASSQSFPIALAWVLAAAMTAAGARAEPTAADRESARALMDDGYALRGKNDLRGALQRFKAADDIMHVPTTGLEVARTQVPLGLLVEARDTIARIRLVPARPNEPAPFKEARLKADALDASLEGRVPRLTIAVHGAPSGRALSMSIDGVSLPAAAIGLPRSVDPGHHVVVVKTEGASGQRDVDLREGEARSLDVALETSSSSSGPSGLPPGTAQPAAATSGPAADASGADNANASTLRTSHAPDTLTWTGGALAGVGLVVGVVSGAMSMSKTSSLAGECPNRGCPPAAYSSYDSASTLATISTVSFVAGGVGACLAVISLVAGHEEKTEPAATPASAGPHVSPWIGAAAAGVRGSF